MATNRDLLKEAIADAKSVKDTAIANAKAALEEAFTPYLKEKLSAKLQEMEEDDEIMEEVEVNEEAEVDEISLEELLAELESDEDLNEAKGDEDEEESDDDDNDEEESEEEMSIEDMEEDDLKSFIEDVIRDMVAAGELEASEEGGEDDEELEMEDEDEEGIEIEDDEEIDVNELLSEEEEVSLDELLAELEDDEMNEELEDDEMNEEVEDDELKEAMSTIQSLKNELNEINLLNSKLLYTNKLFRNKSLTESQKVKVLSAFDKATSKKESQLVYETLLESLKPTVKKSPLQEGMGSASRALGVAKSKPIIEDDAFSRMRELAFGKK